MLAFPSMIIEAAREARMKVPDIGGAEDEFDAEEFPHFAVFCNVQLCRPMQWGEHWENVKIIAKIPNDKIKNTTLE